VPLSTPVRRRRADATANRAGILSAATVTLAADANATLDAIARSAGLSRRALYGHFDDRDALARAVIDHAAVRFAAIADGVTDEDAPLALARLTVLLWRDAAHVSTVVSLDDAYHAEAVVALEPLRRRVLAIILRGQAADELRTDVDAPMLARLVEETARAVIARLDRSALGASGIAVRAVLGIAGLSWREADALLRDHPGLTAAGDDATEGDR
jgi:AcrR family transcriptional regulator